MEKHDVQKSLAQIGLAERQWKQAQRKFNADVALMMKRLLHEAARNRMSVEEVARFSGMSPRRVRTLMRLHGLDPRSGKNLLAETAAKALNENAALLGVKPDEIDLMSPLAYLPMGEQMRRELQEKTVSKVVELDEFGFPETKTDLVTMDLERAADNLLQLIRRGGARITIEGEDDYEVRLSSDGGDPERWGLSREDWRLVLGADL